MKRIAWAALGVTVLAAAALVAWQRMARDVRIDATDARTVARGQQVYGERCAACHGRNLEGQPLIHDKRREAGMN